MSQSEDIAAMKNHILKTNAKTPKALAKQVEVKLWSDNLGWYDTSANADTLAKMKRYRDDFDSLNGAPKLKGYSTEKSKVLADTGIAPARFTPTAPSEPAKSTSQRLTIKLGSTGPNVVEWQTFLKLTPDGRFGPDTRLKTIDYQKNNGLFADGVVGPVTWKKALGLHPIEAIKSAAKKIADAVTPTGVVSGPKQQIASRVASTSATTTILRQGSKGENVKNWQKVIGEKEDGIFGPGTTKTTMAWQSKNGLTADGVVGPASWAAAIVLENQPNKKMGDIDSSSNKLAIKVIEGAKNIPIKTAAVFTAMPLWQKIVGSSLALALTIIGIKAVKGPSV